MTELLLRGAGRGTRGTVTNIPAAGKVLHLAADSLLYGNLDPVAQWDDISGRGHHATQATAGAQPQFRTNVFNGKPAVYFDGVNDVLTVPHHADLALTGDMTIFAVARADDYATSRPLVTKANGAQAAPWDWYLNAGNAGRPDFYVGNGTTSQRMVGENIASTVDANLFTIRVRSDEMRQFVSSGYDGALRITQARADAGTPVFVGGRHDAGIWMKGFIAEVIIYNRAMTPDETTAIEDELAAKYGFVIAQPTLVDPTTLAGLVLYLRAANGYSAGVRVAQWNDESGAARHATQGTAAARPVYELAGGQAAIYFAGDKATHAERETLNLPDFMTGYTEGEAFVVLRTHADPQTGGDGVPFRTGSEGGMHHYAIAGSGDIYDGFGSTSRPNSGNPSRRLDIVHVYNVSSKAGEWRNAINGIAQYAGGNTVGFRSNPNLGSSRTPQSGDTHFKGHILRVVMFNRVLTAAERSGVLEWLMHAHAIT